MYTAKNNDLTTQIKVNTSLTLDIGSKNNKNAQTIKQITLVSYHLTIIPIDEIIQQLECNWHLGCIHIF